MKLRQHSILRLIYACLLAIPMVSVLSRVIYVQSNKNAHESYFGETINEKQILPVNEFKVNDTYIFTSINGTTQYVSSGMTINFSMIEIITSNNVSIDNLNLIINSNSMLINYSSSTYLRFNTNGTNTYVDFSSQAISFKFIYINGDNVQNSAYPLFTQETYNKYSYLDNAFDYSLSKFVSDNDFGKLNLFQWFWSIFLTNNSQNMLYIHFVNWYMNYALLVSSAYILFLVLMWFINFSRRILERGMNYDW